MTDKIAENTEILEKTAENPNGKVDKAEPKKKRKKSAAKEDVAVKDAAPDKKEESKTASEQKSKAEPKKKRKAKVVDDGSRDTKALLIGASQTKRILTGMLEGVEYDENVADADLAVKCILYNDAYRIIIPASHMGIDIPEGVSNQEKVSLYRKYLGAMIGSTIDYVILKVDNKEHIAAGSRKIAMAIKRKHYYMTVKHGLNVSFMEHCVGAKIPVDARVMSVAGSVVRLDVYGVDTKVYAKDAAWRYTSNLSDLFAPGDEIKVLVKSIDKNEKGDIKIDVSIKEATPNNQAENILKYKVNSVYVGIVSGVNANGYYIDIGDSTTGITAFCTAIHGAEIPQIGDKVSCQIVKIDEESGFTLTKITRIIQKANRNRLR
jgi:predicted RNA-binding protein with RPS1 domain